MSRLIDAVDFRNLLKEKVKNYAHGSIQRNMLYAVMQWLDQVQRQEAEPVRHEHWIDGEDIFGAKRGTFRVCSYCNICIPITRIVPNQFWQYCPNCGSKMDGDKK